MADATRIVEFWETEQLPSMQKTSDGFHDQIEQSLTPDRLQALFDHPYLSREEISKQQFARVQELVRIAYDKVPFYRQKYDAAGFHPDDLQTWDDYHRMPYVTKDELIAAFPDQCVNTDFDHSDLFPTRSSGSSGKTLRIYVDPEAIVTDTLQGLRQFWLQTGGRYGADDTIAHVYTVPWWIDHFGEEDYQNIFVSSLISPDKVGEIVNSIQPEVLSLYPSNLAAILPYLDDAMKERLRVVVTHSEMSSRQERERYAQVLGRLVLDEYSSEELTRIALELPETDRYFVCEDSVRLDILDPVTMQPMEQGTGLVVATNLLNTAMPFIRYVQGDYVTIGEQKPSEINWKQIERVEGRLNDSFVRQDGAEIPAGTILDISYRWMFDVGINVQEFEVVQDSPLHVTVNVFEPKMCGNEELVAKSSDHVRELLQYVLGGKVEVDFNLVDSIQSNGKKRRPIRRTF